MGLDAGNVRLVYSSRVTFTEDICSSSEAVGRTRKKKVKVLAGVDFHYKRQIRYPDA